MQVGFCIYLRYSSTMRQILLALTFLTVSLQTHAQSLRFVLDTEVNTIFQNILTDLDPEESQNIRLYLGIAPDVNAFVTANRDMFIFSGLIQSANSIDNIQGVLAHELAHLKAGHLEQGSYAREVAQKRALITSILGLGALVAGAPDAGGAVILGGQGAAISGVLKHTRTAEAEADNIAAEMLTNKGYSLKGMVEFFRKLHTQNFLRFGPIPPYLLTHPLPSQRVSALTQKLENANEPPNPNTLNINFERLKAKVYAFAHTPTQTFRKYGQNTSFPANYAKAIAYTIKGDATNARRLLKAMPTPDAYVQELLGDVELNAGNLTAAKKYFTQAQNTLKAPLISYKLAQTETALGNHQAALIYAQAVFPHYSHFAPAWQQLGVIYGRLGQKVESHTALAEAAFRRNDKEAVNLHITLAEKNITHQTSGALKAQIESLKNQHDDLK